MRPAFKKFKAMSKLTPSTLLMPGLPHLDLGSGSLVMLALLMDMQLQHNPKDSDGGWWRCRDQDIEGSPKRALFPSSITRALAPLEKAGLIKTRVVGKPPSRWVWIDFQRIAEESERGHQQLMNGYEKEGHRLGILK